MSDSSIAVVGGGIAGLSTARALVSAGKPVMLISAETPGESGASPLAAGMLAPVNELEFNELELLRLGIAARDYYHILEAELGDIGLDRSGTLEIGLEPDDAGYLRRLYDYQQKQGLNVEWCGPERLRELEPVLAGQVQCGIWSPDDIQVDNRKLLRRLAEWLRDKGVEFRTGFRLDSYKVDNRVELQLSGTDGQTEKMTFDQVVVACGTGPASLPYRIYPIRGQMISLVPDAKIFPLQKVLRIRNKTWGNAYIVPKSERLLMGSTSEEKGRIRANTAGGLLDILRKCYTAAPGLYELEIEECFAGLRPATLSRQPVIGPEVGGKVWHLNGLYRHGILLGPFAADRLVAWMLHGERDPLIAPFGLGRHTF